MKTAMTWFAVLLCALFVLGVAGCDQGDDAGAVNTLDSGDQVPSTQGTADGDIDVQPASDSSAEADDTNASFRGEPCNTDDPDPEKYNYGTDYPAGPYGFKGSVCWSVSDSAEISYEWKGGGDTVHNICLPNQDGDEVCLSDFYKGDYDLLLLAFDALWCPVCQQVMRDEKAFREALAESGWKVMTMSVIENGMAMGSVPTQDDAASWHETFSLEFDTLYDETWTWADKALIDSWGDPGWGEYGRWQLPGIAAFPFHFYVNLQSMRVWDRFDGWFDSAATPIADFAASEAEVLGSCKDKPGS